MSFRVRKKAADDPHKRSHVRPTYSENVKIIYDGENLEGVCKTTHARDTLCRVYGYHAVEESEPEPDVVDSGPDAGDFSVSSLESKLDDGDFDSQLLQLLASEEGGKNRKTAIQAIQDRIDFIGE